MEGNKKVIIASFFDTELVPMAGFYIAENSLHCYEAPLGVNDL